MMVRVIWYNQGPADPETVYANIPGAGTQTGMDSDLLPHRCADMDRFTFLSGRYRAISARQVDLSGRFSEKCFKQTVDSKTRF